MKLKDGMLHAMDEHLIEREEGGRKYRCLGLEDTRDLARRFDTHTREVGIFALENGVLPLRYAKNVGTIGLDGQARLLRSKVVVIGVGGIGGNAITLLARLGVGTIVTIDRDSFDETNLNRQCFAVEGVIGAPKVEAARRYVSEINRDVDIVSFHTDADRENLPRLITGAHAVIDALDSIDDRLVLQEACREQGVVMVHGAIAGTCLQITTIYPGDPGLEGVSGPPGRPTGSAEKVRGIEVETGNPATTPAIAAGFQVQEAIKVILGCGETLRGRMLYLDIDDWTLEFIEL